MIRLWVETVRHLHIEALNMQIAVLSFHIYSFFFSSHIFFFNFKRTSLVFFSHFAINSGVFFGPLPLIPVSSFVALRALYHPRKMCVCVWFSAIFFIKYLIEACIFNDDNSDYLREPSHHKKDILCVCQRCYFVRISFAIVFLNLALFFLSLLLK